MRSARIIHNPKAGGGQFTKEQLTDILEHKGFKLSYRSTKTKGWDDLQQGDDLLIVAGGDGTVRKVVTQLLNRKLQDKQYPVVVIPLGTANNIAKTLHTMPEPAAVIENWDRLQSKRLDISRLEGIKDHTFFIEGLGIGVFPNLMKALKEQERRKKKHPDQEIKSAQELLYDLVIAYKPKFCKLEIDGRDYSGNYVMVEVMNIKSIGPNLYLAPEADPGDGCLDVVLIPARDQNKLAMYLLHKVQGIEEPFNFEIVRGRKISMQWKGVHAHVDDQLIKINGPEQITAEVQPALLEFLVTRHV